MRNTGDALASLTAMVVSGFLCVSILHADQPFLTSPIQGYTPFTIPISSVFDHSMTKPYNPNNEVIAYTDERGYAGLTRDPSSGCYAQQDNQPFEVNGYYVGTTGTEGPIHLCYDGHPGIDFRFETGTPIYAVAVGTVTEVENSCQSGDRSCGRGAGNYVKIDHQNGYQTLYFHLRTGSVIVWQGQTVQQSQKIGEVGSTGDSTGPHLHFEVRKNVNGQWIPVDPYGWQGPGPDPYTMGTNVNLWLSGSPCHQYSAGSSIPQGFGVPWNVFKPSELLLQAFCSASSASIILGNQSPLTYIYKTGYLNKPGSPSWAPISYTSTEALISGAWYPMSATATIPMTASELQNQSYILGYLCTWTGSQWKCGCRDQACTQSYWQLQGVQQRTGALAVNLSQEIAADVPPPPPPPPSPSLAMTLSLNQTAFRTSDTLRVGLGARNPDPAFLADFYFGVILPDGVTVLFVTSLSPLNGVVSRLDADPRTFRPLLANVQLPQGLDITLPDFFVYPFAGGEPSGTYTIFAVLTPPGAFTDGRADPGDLLVIDARPFSFSP